MDKLAKLSAFHAGDASSNLAGVTNEFGVVAEFMSYD